jgi:translation elongation factor EF-4
VLARFGKSWIDAAGLGWEFKESTSLGIGFRIGRELDEP